MAVCALAVLTAGLLATPSLAQAEDDTVTTTLEPGPNLAGWTQSAADIEVIFDAIPELEVVYAWDGQHQRFLWAVRTDAGLLGDLKELNPGMGLWLLLGGEEPFIWTRPLVERAGALSLQEGWNLVAWAAGGGASPSDALQGLSDILTAAADATGAEPSSLSRGGAFWLKTSAPAVWEQPTTLASPERMEAIQDLPWVKDGLTDFEEASVDDLRYLAEARPRSFRALMQKSWIEGQHDLAMQNVLLYLAHMARQSREAPVYDILQMTLLDSVTRSNHALRTAMSEIVFGRQEGWEQSLRKIAAASRREEDITGWNISLQYIRERDPEVSEIVEKIPWIAEILRGSSVREDDLNDHSAILRTVTRMYIRYPLLLDKLLSWEWFSETPSRSTYSIVESLDNLARYVGKDFALLVAGMPFLDTIDGYEWEAMEFLQGLARSDKQEVVETVARASSVDGIDDEGALLLRLAYLQANDVPLGGVLGNMAWLGDGVADSERSAAVLVQHLAFEAEPLLHSLAARGWLDDGVSRAEEGVLDQFLSLAGRVARKDIAVAVRISGMPFLDSVDGADAAAMRSLVGIHWEGSESPLMDILDHPTLEGGLADEDTPLVAVLHDVGRGGGADFNKDVALAVLEPGAFKVETRVVPVPGLEEVRLAVVA
ncbi:MAG: hypothetical protein F4151_00425, partial [Gammaproteobacteria bacterium]|nr:hypothetical protein [Gammaproteobacteria bacterium]